MSHRNMSASNLQKYTTQITVYLTAVFSSKFVADLLLIRYKISRDRCDQNPSNICHKKHAIQILIALHFRHKLSSTANKTIQN